MRLRCTLPEIDEFFPELRQQSESQKRSGSLAVAAIMDGLALNRLFDPGALDLAQLSVYLRLCVRKKLELARENVREQQKAHASSIA